MELRRRSWSGPLVISLLGALGFGAGAQRVETRAQADLVLPEPVDAASVLRAIADRPQDHVVVDVRPAWQFAEWRVPSSVNVAPGALTAHLAALPAHVRVVIVDRDGTLAFAVAGAIGANVPQRPLRVVLGGVQACYAAGAFGTPVPTTRGEERPQVPAPSTSQPKKRSAGC